MKTLSLALVLLLAACGSDNKGNQSGNNQNGSNQSRDNQSGNNQNGNNPGSISSNADSSAPLLSGSYRFSSVTLDAINQSLSFTKVSYSNMYLTFNTFQVEISAKCNTPEGSRTLRTSASLNVSDNFYEVLDNGAVFERVGDYECNLEIEKETVQYRFNSQGNLELSSDGVNYLVFQKM